MPRRPTRQPVRGFTLLELMVVIVVLGIIAALIAPEFKGTYQAAVLSSSGRQVMTALRLARSQAVTTGKTVRFRWQPDRHSYLLESEIEPEASGRGAAGARDVAPLERVPGASGALSPEVRLAVSERGDTGTAREPPPAPRRPGRDAGAGIEFHPDGTATAAEIELSERSGGRLVLAVLPATGRVVAGRSPR